MLFVVIVIPDKPRLLEGPVGGKVTVVEGGVAVLGVKAKGNPDTVKYKWMRVLSSSNGSSSSNQVVKTRARKVFVDGGVVNFTEVSRKDRGKYVVEASNSEGTATFNVDLDVQCMLKQIQMEFFLRFRMKLL